MNAEIRENYREKLRLTVEELISELGGKFKEMLAKHAAEGMLRSGNTIKRTMDLINEGSAHLFQETLEHLRSLA